MRQLTPIQEARRQELFAELRAKVWTPDRAENIFSYRPRKGDIWEVRIPGKSKMTKEVGRVHCDWYRRDDESHCKHPTVDWCRLPKGRHTSIRVKWLLKFGKLVRRSPSTTKKAHE